MALWGGRFVTETDELMRCFGDSIGFDRRMYAADVRASVAYAAALARAGLITIEERDQLVAGLEQVRAEFDAGTFQIEPGDEDIHTAVERRLGELIGDPSTSSGQALAGKLHTGRSRNDQVATDLRLYLMREIPGLRQQLGELQEAILTKAEQHLDVIMPGYTHLQRAQPVSAAAYLLAYVEQFERDRGRLIDCCRRANVCPLGTGAVAGTTLPIDRRLVAQKLGFPAVTGNSIDTSADRDFCIEFVAACALTMVHLSRLAEDWIIYSSQEFGFIVIDERYCTGSSMMPQKRNPDLLELIRARAAGVIGALNALLVVMKGTPLAYNRDMQEDKRHVFAAHDATKASLTVAGAIIRHSRFDPQRTAEATRRGYLTATGLAEYLVRKAVPFREAHQIVGKLVADCEAQGLELSELRLEQLQQACPRIEPDVYEYLLPERLVARYSSEAAAGGEPLAEQLRRWQARLEQAARQTRPQTGPHSGPRQQAD